MMKQTFKQQIDELLKAPPARSVSSPLNYMYPTFDVGENSQFEQILNHTKTHLAGLRRTHPGAMMLHIGFASFTNLDILAEGQHDYAIFCDYNRQTPVVWKEIFSLIQSSNSPGEFKEKMRGAFPHKDRISGQQYSNLLKTEKWAAPLTFANPTGRLTIANPGEKKIEDYFTRSRWLHDEKSFMRIKAMVEEGRITAVTMDALERPRMEKLGKWLTEKNYTVGTLYASNIGYYLAPTVDLFNNNAESMEERLNRAYKSGQTIEPHSGRYVQSAEHILEEKTHGYHQDRLPKNPGRVFQENIRLLCGPDTMVFHASRDKDYGMPGPFPLIVER